MVQADLYTTANNNTIYLFTTVAYPRQGHRRHIALHAQFPGEKPQEKDKGQVVGDGHAALQNEVFHGQEYAAKSGKQYQRYIWGVLRSTLLLILPVSAVLAAFGTPIVQVPKRTEAHCR